MTNTQRSSEQKTQPALEDFSVGYQQALNDFGISELLEKLNNFSDSNSAQCPDLEQQELDLIAAWLIGQLTVSLKGGLIAKYLSVIRKEDTNAISDLLLIELQPQKLSTFPTSLSVPLFSYGDHLCWKPLGARVETDWGVVIGRVYLPAAHQGLQWSWKYLVLLGKDSPSAAWTIAETAWEDDLQQRAIEVTS